MIKEINSKNLPLLPKWIVTHILSYNVIGTEFLKYRLLSKAFSKSIFTNREIYPGHRKENLIFFNKNLIFIDEECRAMFRKKIFPLLDTADEIYHFITKRKDDPYPEFKDFAFSKFILKEDGSKNIKKQKTYTSFEIDKVLTNFIINRLNKQAIYDLDFSELSPNKFGMFLLRNIIVKMGGLTKLDLSNTTMKEDEIINLIDAVGNRINPLKLYLKGVEPTLEILVNIQNVSLHSSNKTFEIDDDEYPENFSSNENAIKILTN